MTGPSSVPRGPRARQACRSACSAVVALAAGALLSGLVRDAVNFAGVTSRVVRTPSAKSHLTMYQILGPGDGTAVATEEAAGSEASDSGSQKPLVPELFPVVYVTNKTRPKELSWIVGRSLEEGNSTAVDVHLIGGSKRLGCAMHLFACLGAASDSLKDGPVAVQVLPRRRDQKRRFRVYKACPIQEDKDALIVKLGAGTDFKKSATYAALALRPNRKNSTAASKNNTVASKNTVELQFVGYPPAIVAGKVIEELFWQLRGELTFRAEFTSRSIEGDGNDNNKPQVSVFVTAS